MRFNPIACLILASVSVAILGNTSLRADPLTGSEIVITSQLNGGPVESATVVDNSDGAQFDSSALNFSWMIPGDYVTFGYHNDGLDAFALMLSGNSTFAPTDVLDVSFTLASGMTFDASDDDLSQAYFGASMSTDKNTLDLHLTELDSISGLIDNVNTNVEALSRVQVPDASSTFVLLATASLLVLGLSNWGQRRRAVAAG